MFSFIISGLAYVVAVDYRMQVAVIVQALFVGPGTKPWWKQHQKLKLHPKQQQVQIWQNRILHTTTQVRSTTNKNKKWVREFICIKYLCISYNIHKIMALNEMKSKVNMLQSWYKLLVDLFFHIYLIHN